jgi:hypothetical protein
MSDAYTPGPQPPQMGAFSLAENAPQPMMPGMPMGMPMMEPPPEKRFDCKIKRCIKSGRLLIDILPPEDLLMDNQATRIDEDRLRFIGDKSRLTRAKLKLRYPEKKAIIDELPAYMIGVDRGGEKQSRENDTWGLRNTVTDPDSEQVEIFELYVKTDFDGDGIQEWRQIVVGGIMGQRHILSNEEWGGLLPYTDIVPNPQPHRWRGRSLFEDCYDVSRVKTVLLRQTLDNLYLTSNPRQGADENKISNKEAVVNQELGATVWTKGDPNGAIVPFVTPFVGKDSMMMMEYQDLILAKRTGVSKESMGLDPDTLQNQTATANNNQVAASHTKIETFARNIAECGGLKRLFKCILRLFCENQRSARTIRLRGKWVQVDPRSWDADMDVEINVGLGAGTKDRDLAMLQGVAMKQELAVQALGTPFNPLLNVGHIFDTYRKMAETSGLKNPRQYFPEVTQDQVAQIKAQMDQNPPPNPEAMKAQAQMQIETMKLQATMQQKQAEMAAAERQAAMDFQREQQGDERKAQIEQVQMQADIATNREKVAADIQIAREKFEFDKQLALIEHQAKMAELQMQAQQKEREAQIRESEMQQNVQMRREEHHMGLQQSERQHQQGLEQADHSAEMSREAHDQKMEQAKVAAKTKAKTKDAK